KGYLAAIHAAGFPTHRPLLRDQLHSKTALHHLRGNDLADLRVLGIAARRIIKLDVAAVRVTCLSQNLFGLLGIVRIPFELGIGTEDIGANRAIDRVTDPVEYILDNGGASTE